MAISPEFDVAVQAAKALVAADRRPRWVYMGADGPVTSLRPVPCYDKVSVYWLPTVDAVGFSWSPRKLAHAAMKAVAVF